MLKGFLLGAILVNASLGYAQELNTDAEIHKHIKNIVQIKKDRQALADRCEIRNLNYSEAIERVKIERLLIKEALKEKQALYDTAFNETVARMVTVAVAMPIGLASTAVGTAQVAEVLGSGIILDFVGILVLTPLAHIYASNILDYPDDKGLSEDDKILENYKKTVQSIKEVRSKNFATVIDSLSIKDRWNTTLKGFGRQVFSMITLRIDNARAMDLLVGIEGQTLQKYDQLKSELISRKKIINDYCKVTPQNEGKIDLLPSAR